MEIDMRGREWRAQVPVGALMSGCQGTRLAWELSQEPQLPVCQSPGHISLSCLGEVQALLPVYSIQGWPRGWGLES